VSSSSRIVRTLCFCVKPIVSRPMLGMGLEQAGIESVPARSWPAAVDLANAD